MYNWENDKLTEHSANAETTALRRGSTNGGGIVAKISCEYENPHENIMKGTPPSRCVVVEKSKIQGVSGFQGRFIFWTSNFWNLWDFDIKFLTYKVEGLTNRLHCDFLKSIKSGSHSTQKKKNFFPHVYEIKCRFQRLRWQSWQSGLTMPWCTNTSSTLDFYCNFDIRRSGC